MHPLSFLLLSLGLPLISAAALPQTTPATCTGGTFDSCVASVMCVQSWPESCICHNNQVDTCATACYVTPPAGSKQNCSTITTRAPAEEDTTCVNDCLANLACIQVWPGSCYCENRNRRMCAEQCGTAVTGLRDCPPESSSS
ncbi:hypothetical protein K440DRAFT_632429 [Wilcoxina mikolae CBS 423.85]|nr:hypothetical protein K440DRAFT_632429 [Wilcoxina mikolae CBS 423.85]